MTITEAQGRLILAAYLSVLGATEVLPRGTAPTLGALAPADWGLIHAVWRAFPALKDPASPLAVNDGLHFVL